MGSSDKFCLRWNDFESNISAAFGAVREDGDFFDVRLACEDGSKQIPAHRLVLSACSDFFRTVLRGMGSGRISSSGQNSVLYLRGVTYTDLEAVLNFMYHGEANVAQDDLNNFLAVAEELCVKGLIGEDQKGAKAPASAPKSIPPLLGVPGMKRSSGRPPAPIAKRPKTVDTGSSSVKVKSEIPNIGPAEDDFVEDAGIGGEGDYSGADSFDDGGGGDGGYGEMEPVAGTSGEGGVEDTKGFACGDEKPIVDDYLQGADFTNESNFSSADFEDKTRPQYKTNPGGLPPHVKEAIKSKYEAGVTRPKEIINSLVKDGIMEHDSFPMNKFYNHIKEMKRKMSGKRRKRRLKLAIGGLEM